MPIPDQGRTFEDAAKCYAEKYNVQIRVNVETKQVFFDTDDSEKVNLIVKALEAEFGDCFE